MSLRWRCDGTLVCGAKSQPREGDTYIDDRLHYRLSAELAVVVPDADEKITGLWLWADGSHAAARWLISYLPKR
ncbi:hypothetical protein LCGC14_1179990 [marine sediment metagenome]|uniref:Uncharacterized protein n=1 Tax=marine sediment metagenome TaxID=412755 RepID=A0A0F9PSU7_9ZZZZ